MPDASSPSDPSRHASIDEPVEPIPIPDVDARSRKARTVRIQDILAAHARALDVRLEEGMREMRLAMEAALRRTAIQEAPPAQPQAIAPVQPPPAAPPPQPVVIQQPSTPVAPREDVARGLAQQTEERFQSLALRLQRIEDAIRTVALAGGDASELGSKLDALTDGMSRVAASEEDLFDRLLDSQRDALEDLTRRVGQGVSAVIRAMQSELNATITRLELTADATAAVSPGDTARLERTMMAIAEHQEAVLDHRLTELRQSMGGFTEAEQTAAVVEQELAFDEEGSTIAPDEPFPWPEPVPDEPVVETDEAIDPSEEGPEDTADHQVIDLTTEEAPQIDGEVELADEESSEIGKAESDEAESGDDTGEAIAGDEEADESLEAKTAEQIEVEAPQQEAEEEGPAEVLDEVREVASLGTDGASEERPKKRRRLKRRKKQEEPS